MVVLSAVRLFAWELSKQLTATGETVVTINWPGIITIKG